MALKGQSGTFGALFISVLLSLGCGIGLLLVQHFCMDKSDGDIIIGKYCSDLSSNRVATISSVLVQVMTTLMAFSLAAAVCAFRTKRLEKGIPEGIYVALGGKAWKYQVAAMLTKWWGVVAVILLFTYGPIAVQPLLNFSQSPQVVYNWIDAGDSTGQNFTIATYPSDALTNGHRSVYNELTGDFVAERISTYTIVYNGTDPLAATLRWYTSAAAGAPVLGEDLTVETEVIREGIIAYTDSKNNTAATPLQVFEFRDTIANVTSSCSIDRPVTFGYHDIPDDGFNGTWDDFLSEYQGSGEIQHAKDDSDAKRILFFQIQELTTAPHLFHGNIASASFSSENGTISPSSNKRMCNFSITLGEGHAMINPRTRNVTMLSPMSSGPTTVDTAIFQRSMNTLILDGADLGTLAVAEGFLADSVLSWLHARVCSAVSLSLNFMHFSNEYVHDEQSDELVTVNATYYMDTYFGSDSHFSDFSDYSSYDDYVYEDFAEVPLYSPLLVTYMPGYAAWLFAGVLVGLNIFLCVIALVFTISAKMNVKGNAENALFDNLSAADVALRTGVALGDDKLAADMEMGKDLSNDENAQRKHAFQTMLYTMDASQGNAVRVGFGSKGSAL